MTSTSSLTTLENGANLSADLEFNVGCHSLAITGKHSDKLLWEHIFLTDQYGQLVKHQKVVPPGAANLLLEPFTRLHILLSYIWQQIQ